MLNNGSNLLFVFVKMVNKIFNKITILVVPLAFTLFSIIKKSFFKQNHFVY